MAEGANIAQSATWPIRRLLDPRFADLTRRVAQLTDLAKDEFRRTQGAVGEIAGVVTDHAEALLEVSTHLGERLQGLDSSVERLEGTIQQLGVRIGGIERELEQQLWASRLKRSAQAGVEELDEPLSELLDVATGPGGFAAAAGLPAGAVGIEHRPGELRVATLERVAIEEPFALRALANLGPGARVLLAIGEPSTLPLSLAALGYDVVALAPAAAPLEHPRLEWAAISLQDYSGGGRPADAALVLGHLELPGGTPESDRQTLEHLRSLVAPGAPVVLTARTGVQPTDPATPRTFEPAAIEALLRGWELVERVDVARTGPATWEPGTVATGEGLVLAHLRLAG